MRFTLSEWAKFCKNLQDNGHLSNTALDLYLQSESKRLPFIVLKHDVETNVKRAYRIAKIESQSGHRGSFYVQAYLLNRKRNIEILKKIQGLGHEVSYHHDVMDFAKGDLQLALSEFKKNLTLFIENGFYVDTVCQHGNPLIERIGYSSNRDFFRSKEVQTIYPQIEDIMVNFKNTVGLDYLYFSDAGRKMQLIFDPLTNDICKSDEKNHTIEDFDKLQDYIARNNCIVSIHPHRWETNLFIFYIKKVCFNIVRKIAKLLYNFTLFKKLANRFYYLAKKI